MNERSERGVLPHHAKGLALGPAALIFAQDKIVLSGGGSRTHLTVHLSPHQRMYDIHETHTDPDGSKSYTTLYTISHANLELLIREIGPGVLRAFRDLHSPLRIGWMARRRIGVVVGLIPRDDDIEKVSRVRRGKLVIDPDKLASHAYFPEYLEELYDLGDGDSFTVFDYRKPGSPRLIGIGFKFTDALARPRLTWFRTASVGQVAKRLTEQFREAAARYGTFHKPLPWRPFASTENGDGQVTLR